MKLCPQCSTPNGPNALFCQRCGLPLSQVAPAQQPVPQAPSPWGAPPHPGQPQGQQSPAPQAPESAPPQGYTQAPPNGYTPPAPFAPQQPSSWPGAPAGQQPPPSPQQAAWPPYPQVAPSPYANQPWQPQPVPYGGPAFAPPQPAQPQPAETVFPGGLPGAPALPAENGKPETVLLRSRSNHLYPQGHVDSGSATLTDRRIAYYQYTPGHLLMYGAAVEETQGQFVFHIPLDRIDRLTEEKKDHFTFLVLITKDNQRFPLFFDDRDEWKRAIQQALPGSPLPEPAQQPPVAQAPPIQQAYAPPAATPAPAPAAAPIKDSEDSEVPPVIPDLPPLPDLSLLVPCGESAPCGEENGPDKT